MSYSKLLLHTQACSAACYHRHVFHLFVGSSSVSSISWCSLFPLSLPSHSFRPLPRQLFSFVVITPLSISSQSKTSSQQDSRENAPSQARVLEERRGQGHCVKRALRERRWYGIGSDVSWRRGEGRAPGQTRPGGEGRRVKRALGGVGAGTSSQTRHE